MVSWFVYGVFFLGVGIVDEFEEFVGLVSVGDVEIVEFVGIGFVLNYDEFFIKYDIIDIFVLYIIE